MNRHKSPALCNRARNEASQCCTRSGHYDGKLGSWGSNWATGVSVISPHVAHICSIFYRGPPRVSANSRRATAKKLCLPLSTSFPRSFGTALAFDIRQRIRTFYGLSAAARSAFACAFENKNGSDKWRLPPHPASARPPSARMLLRVMCSSIIGCACPPLGGHHRHAGLRGVHRARRDDRECLHDSLLLELATHERQFTSFRQRQLTVSNMAACHCDYWVG